MIPVGDFRIGDEERAAIERVLDSGRISESREVRAFENEFAAWLGVKHAVAVSNGTAALMCGLLALQQTRRIKPYRKIITSPLTFIATINAIVLSGFEPVFVDVDAQTFGILPEQIDSLLSKADNGEYTAILPVHLLGYPCDMAAIMSIAERYRLAVLEDAAEAHGTCYRDKPVGGWGDMGAFSFYIAHNIQAGEMGAIVTDSSSLAALARQAKAHGRLCSCRVCTRREGKCPQADGPDPRFTHTFPAYNFKTMEFPAALARVQLQRADAIIIARRRNVRMLNELLADCAEFLRLPVYSDDVSYLAYPLVLKRKCPITRDEFRHKLEARGIETRPLFGCVPIQQPAYRHMRAQYAGRLPRAEYIGANGFYVGCHQYLTESDIERIAEAIKEILNV